MLSLRIARSYHAQLKSSHAPYLRHSQLQFRLPFTTFPPLRRDSKSDSDEPKVRWYEQLLPWSSKRRRIDPDSQGAQLDEEIKSVRRQIRQLDDELKEMETPVSKTGKTMIEPLIATLSPEDQRKVRAAIIQDDLEEKRKESKAAEVKRFLAELVPGKSELEIRWPMRSKNGAYLEVLNSNIQKAAGQLEDQALRKKLWKSYVLCKANFPPFLHLIPEKAWTVLWLSHHTMPTEHPQWASHLITLSEDKLSAGKELDVYQGILYIEALQLEGRQHDAYSEWEKLKGDLRNDEQATEEHQLLGVRMFASGGDPEKAEKIALNYLKREKSEESRILIPIIIAWAQRGDDIGMKHAWALYLRFKAQVGDNMTMEDYDNITMRLLKSGRVDFALAVFKDLMLTGQRTDQGSLELYEKASSLIGKSQSSAITPEDLNKISLTALIALPRRFQNKYFYASWVKKLILMGEVDAAATVVELMYERGVRPDAKHLGAIIGAWLRTGNDREKRKAEKMAWAMIIERLDLVNRRRYAPTTSDVPSAKRRTITPASIETFNLLLQHYGRRSQDANIQLIQDCLGMADLAPNSFFINHLLYVDLRKGQHGSAWKRYERMFRRIQPDLETFACLWDCEKAHLNKLDSHAKNWFPGPREIMSDMMNWYSSQWFKKRQLVREEFSQELYNQIIRCFGRAADLEGTIVALYAMKESFGFYPDEQAARTVSIEVGRMGIGEEKKPGRRRRGNPQRERNAERIARAFTILTEQREQYLTEAGLNVWRQCDANIQREEFLFILAEFLRAVLRRTSVDADAVEANIEKAAWEMGVSGVPMDDPLPSYDVPLKRHD